MAGQRRLASSETLATLHPSYFAMVMATGIVSLAAHMLDMGLVAQVLFWINVPAYLVLVTLFGLRAAYCPRHFFADLIGHQRGPGFFTFVAGTCVLGSQALQIVGAVGVAFTLWGIALVAWLGLTYTVFTALIVKRDKPGLVDGLNGGWLLAVVATQSIAVLAALLAPYVEQPIKIEMNFLALSMWLWGGMLYIWMMSLIFYRYTFFPFSPDDLSPPYWINMGAMAISTLAGALLISNASPDAPYLLSLQQFLKGFTVFYWATATWWVPMLVVLGVWRHGYRRHPFAYDPLYWGLVFPLGMYTAATLLMSQAMQLPFMRPVAGLFIYVALFAWVCVFMGLVRQLRRPLAVLLAR